jgi:hypothetical protein
LLVAGDEGGPIELVFRVTGDSLDPVGLKGVGDDECGDQGTQSDVSLWCMFWCMLVPVIGAVHCSDRQSIGMNYTIDYRQVM